MRGGGGARAPLVLTAGLAGLAAPLLAARVLWPPPPGDGPVAWECPLLHATGVPCPACGATRAFVHFVHGDEGFLHYNWAWLLIWGALLAWVALLLVRSLRGAPLAGGRVKRMGALLHRRPAAIVALPFAALAVPWLVALGNVDWIRSY
jgi:Protein of unknown function (DUF2752)